MTEELCENCGAFMEGDKCPKCGWKKLTPEQVAFKDRVAKWKNAESINCTTLEEMKAVYKKWLYLEGDDDDFIDVSLAATLDREIPGDPVWLYMIAPPGGVKSELLRAYKEYNRAYTLDILTASTFISGMARLDKNTDEMVPIAGILQDLDGKTVIIKDFTTLLNSSEENRNEIYGQLRSIYDGYFEKAFGSIRRKVSVTAKIGLVAGVTPIIDKYSAMNSTLGERFLKIRNDPNKLSAAHAALMEEGRERVMRQELSTATRTFLQSLTFDKVPEFTDAQNMDILLMSMYVGFMRANIWCTYEGGQIVDMQIISSEVPTRLAKQFKHLSKLLAIIRGHPDYIDDRDMATLGRVARDTAETKKQAIVDYYANYDLDGCFDPNDIAGAIKGLYRTNIRNHLNILTALDCAEPCKIGYKLTNDFKDYVKAVYRQDRETPIPFPPNHLQKKPENGLFSKQPAPKGIYVNLQTQLEKTLGVISDMEKIRGSVRDDDLFDELEENHGLKKAEATRIIGVLMKDGTIYSPRPGYYGRTA